MKKESCEDWHDIPSDEMTLRQARQAVKDLRKRLAEYLWQEPCENAVSREKVIVIVEKVFWLLLETEEDIENAFEYLEREIKELSPIQPKLKTGKWIRQQSHLDYTHTYECSECGRTIYAEDDDLTDFPYCHCGAKMEVEK